MNGQQEEGNSIIMAEWEYNWNDMITSIWHFQLHKFMRLKNNQLIGYLVRFVKVDRMLADFTYHDPSSNWTFTLM